MNIRNLNFATVFFSIILLLSCEKNETGDDFAIHDYRVHDVLYAKGSKLKRSYDVYDGNNRKLRVEYLYDDLGRISKKDYGPDADIYAYDIYQYDVRGILEKISSYSIYREKPHVLTRTIVYSYDDKGNMEKETEYADNQDPVYNLYQYIDGKRTKQEHYEGTRQTYYIVYEYQSGKPVKEKFHVPGEKGFVTTEHYYDQELLVYSITYNKDPKSGFMHDEKRYYDRNDNLIKTISNMPGLSSMSGATSFLLIWENEYE